MFSTVFNKIKDIFKPKPVQVSIEQALLEGAKAQDAEKTLVDKKQLDYLLELVKNARQERADLLYLCGLVSTVQNATTETKFLIPQLKGKTPKELIFWALQNKDKLASIYEAISLILKSSYHLEQINSIIKKYAR
jgi:hypothetical protein